jgi:hypothetical protein
MKILTPNPTKEKHLEEIKDKMKEMGPPTIRMVDRDDHLVAIEGSHRLHAAKDLGLHVKVKLTDPEKITQNHDFKGLPDKIRIGKLAQNVEMAPQSYITIHDKELDFI